MLDLCVASKLRVISWSIEIGFLPPLFISFDSNTSSNSLLSPVLHVTTPFLLSTDRVHPHILSSAPSIVFPVLVSCASILLLLCTLLPH